MEKSITTRRPLLFTSIIPFVHRFSERHAISCYISKKLEEEINGMALNALFITAFFGTEVCFYVAEVVFDMQIKQDGQYRFFPLGAFQSFHSGDASSFSFSSSWFPFVPQCLITDPLHKLLSRDIF